MKKSVLWVCICALCLLGAVCLLTSCKRNEGTLTEREWIEVALERSGLPGTISESESTYTQDRNPRNYVIRNAADTYEGTENPVFVANVIFADLESEGMLLATFHQSGIWTPSSRRIAWEDWKRQFLFAALLFGDFAQEDEIYRAFCETEMPDGPEPVWLDASLSHGRYCMVGVSCRSQKDYDDRGFEVRRYSADLRINVYVSREQYQKRMAEQKKRRYGDG